MLTQAPPNTGAGWYTLATGAWPGVHGSTNNTFHKNGDAVRQPDGRLRPRRPAGRDDRPVRRARRPQGRAGRVGRRAQRLDQRSDDRLPDLPLGSRRRDQLHRQRRRRAVRRRRLHRRRSGCSSTTPTGTPARRRSPAPSRLRRPAGPTYPRRYSPAHGDAAAGARLRRRQVRPQRLPLRQHRRRRPPTTTGCCSRRPRTAPTPSADLAEGEWADVKVTIVGGRAGRQDRRHAGQGRGADRRPVPGPAVPHLGQPGHRELADLAGRAGLHRASTSSSPPSSRPRPPPTSPSSRPASPARRPTSSRGCTGPPVHSADARVRRADLPARPAAGRHADDRRVPAPVPRAWSPRRCPTAAEPGLRRRGPDGVARRPGRGARGLHPRGLRRVRPDAARWRGSLVGQATRRRSSAPTTASRRSSSPSTPARCSSTSACCRRRRPPTAAPRPARRSARRRPAGPAAPCRSTSTWPDAIPAGGGLQQVAAADEAATVAAIKAAFLGLTGPERLDPRRPAPRAGRSSTGPSPRRSPATSRTGRDSTADMAHPTRTGDLVVFSYPPYQFDAATPGHAGRAVALLRPARLRAGRAGPGGERQHARHVPRRWHAAIAKGTVTARSIDLAPTLAFLLGIPEPQHSQGRVLLDVVKGGGAYTAGLDRRPERLPRPARPDDAGLRHGLNATVGGGRPARDDVRRGAGGAAARTASSSPAATTSGPRRPTRRCSRTCRPSTSRTRGAWTPRRTATTSSTTAWSGCSRSRRAPTSRSWPRTSSRRPPA